MSSTKIIINTKSKSYPIYFGNNIDNCRLTQVFFFREEGAETKFSQPI